MVKVDATEQLESALQKVYEIDIAKPAFGIHSRLLLLRDNPVNVLFVQTAYEKYRQLPCTADEFCQDLGLGQFCCSSKKDDSVKTCCDNQPDFHEAD